MKLKKIALHITFYYQKPKIKRLNQAIIPMSKSDHYDVQIFIHTNVEQDILEQDIWHNGHKHNISIITHKLVNQHNFYLTWKHRKLMHEQILDDNYDVYIYSEDDIQLKDYNIQYWEEYSPRLYKEKINLGFIRSETRDACRYWADSNSNKNKNDYIRNNLLTTEVEYCGFWIYDKKMTEYLLKNTQEPSVDVSIYQVREMAALGLNNFYYKRHRRPAKPKTHIKEKYFFSKTCIPVIGNYIDERSVVSHLSNNYVYDATNEYGNLKVKDICSNAFVY